MCLAWLRRYGWLVGGLLVLACGPELVVGGDEEDTTGDDTGGSSAGGSSSGGATPGDPGVTTGDDSGSSTSSGDPGEPEDCFERDRALQLAEVGEEIPGLVADADPVEGSRLFSVSAAGDVNGDGLADLVVGAPEVSSVEHMAGRTYVVFGKADMEAIALSQVAAGEGGFVVDGWSRNSGSGQYVSGAGDVNGDGLDDVIVGVPEYEAASLAFVVFGKTDTDPVALWDVAEGTGGFELEGDVGWEEGEYDGYPVGYGAVVGAAGDVNGDGLADLLVGAPETSAPEPGSGRAYLVFGKADGNGVRLSAHVSAEGGFVIDGDTVSAGLGASVSGAGDVNQDGLADLVIGAPGSSASGMQRAGRAYVVFGKADIAKVLVQDLEAGTGGYVLAPEGTDDRLGWSVSGAGDTNGDGVADVIVGAIGAGPEGALAGRAYVVFGKADTVAVHMYEVATGSGGFAMTGEAPYDQAARVVTGAGDVNSDGLTDVIVGAPGVDPNGCDSGRSYVVFGKTDTDIVSLVDVAAGAGGFALDGEGDSHSSGWDVSGGEDVNGDGIADVIVLAPGAAVLPGDGLGRAYVVFGG